jgi:NADPH2:quinone reductase
VRATEHTSPSGSATKVIRVREHGPPEVMTSEEESLPRPNQGEALVRIGAAGVNFIEIYQRSGRYQRPLPFVPGTEGAGTVVDLGPGVESLRVGDRVASVRLRGSYAEYAVARAEHLVPIPEEIDMETAAAVMLQGMTAHYLVTTIYPLRPEEWCLVHAGAGGVGRLLCQLAAMRGARPIATVSTDEKAQAALAAGAEAVIRYDRTDFVEEVRGLTEGSGVSVVYDSVGRTTFEGSLDVLRPRGMLVLFGQSSGAVAPFDPQVLNRKGSLFLTRPTLADYTSTREELIWRAGELFAWIRDGKLDVHVHARYPLDQAAAAHRAMEARETTGKLLLVD